MWFNNSWIFDEFLGFYKNDEKTWKPVLRPLDYWAVIVTRRWSLARCLLFGNDNYSKITHTYCIFCKAFFWVIKCFRKCAVSTFVYQRCRNSIAEQRWAIFSRLKGSSTSVLLIRHSSNIAHSVWSTLKRYERERQHRKDEEKGKLGVV